MANFYHCAVCEQVMPKEDIIQFQNTSCITRSWKECPICGSKVMPVSDDNFDVEDLVRFQMHKALS
jgi:hypothetical protein